MKVKSQLYRAIYLAMAIVLCSTCVGCKRDPSKKSDNKPTQTEVTPSGTPDDKGKPTSVEADDSTPSVSPNTTDSPTPTNGNQVDDRTDDDDDPDDEDDIIPTVGDDDSEDDDPEDPDLPMPEEPTPNDILRSEAWNDTFLIWIPEFTEGFFVNTVAEDTEDKAVFTEVDEAHVHKYIEELKLKGFVHEVETQDGANGILYSACNTDKWWAKVKYSNGGLEISSGYHAEQVSAEDKLVNLWTTSLLGLLPMFENGTMTGSGSESNGNAYCVFEEVSEDYVRTYIEGMAGTGFTGESDSGDSDGFIWYSAVNSEEILCDLTFYDGSLKLSVER